MDISSASRMDRCRCLQRQQYSKGVYGQGLNMQQGRVGLHDRATVWGVPVEQALQEGSARGECELAQVPLEAIVSHSTEGLQTVKHFLDASKAGGGGGVGRSGAHACEQLLGSPRLSSPRGSTLRAPAAAAGGHCSALVSPRAGGGGGAFPLLLASPFLSLVAEFGGGDDGFDSGAETDWGGSQATDMCDSCCSD